MVMGAVDDHKSRIGVTHVPVGEQAGDGADEHGEHVQHLAVHHVGHGAHHHRHQACDRQTDRQGQVTLSITWKEGASTMAKATWQGGSEGCSASGGSDPVLWATPLMEQRLMDRVKERDALVSRRSWWVIFCCGLPGPGHRDAYSPPTTKKAKGMLPPSFTSLSASLKPKSRATACRSTQSRHRYSGRQGEPLRWLSGR